MNLETFWQLIEQTRPPGWVYDEDGHYTALRGRLVELPADEILAFADHFEARLLAAYRADLWDVAAIVLDGCGDDDFDYFLGWLIAQGRQVYDAVLAAPERVAEFFPEEDEPTSQRILTVAAAAFGQKTGAAELPLGAREPPQLDRPLSSPRERRARYPELWERFSED
jgi:hypothetical protein